MKKMMYLLMVGILTMCITTVYASPDYDVGKDLVGIEYVLPQTTQVVTENRSVVDLPPAWNRETINTYTYRTTFTKIAVITNLAARSSLVKH